MVLNNATVAAESEELAQVGRPLGGAAVGAKAASGACACFVLVCDVGGCVGMSSTRRCWGWPWCVLDRQTHAAAAGSAACSVCFHAVAACARSAGW